MIENDNTVRDRVENIIISLSGEAPDCPGKDFMLNLNSLTIMKIFVQVEKEFEIEIDLEKVNEETSTTFWNLTQFLCENIEKK